MNNYTNEIWKDVKDYEGLYAVSNLGRIKRVVGKGCKKERIIKPNIVRGYYQVRLSKDGLVKPLYLHRIILETFNPVEGMDKLDCNHRDENKENNCLNNLEWCSGSENVKHSIDTGLKIPDKGEQIGNSVLNEDKVLEIIDLLLNSNLSLQKIGEKFGVSRHTIFDIKRKKSSRPM